MHTKYLIELHKNFSVELKIVGPYYEIRITPKSNQAATYWSYHAESRSPRIVVFQAWYDLVLGL